MNYIIRVALIFSISLAVGYHSSEAFGREYAETCGDFTPVSVLLKKYKPCDGGWCLRK